MFVIFGTTKIARVLSPSLRALPFNGIEWSFMMRDLGFDEFGVKLSEDEEQRSKKCSKAPGIEMQPLMEGGAA